MTRSTVEGPLGFPMTEQAARDVEALLRTLPKDHTYRKVTSVPESVELIAGERADVSLVSVESLDRQSEVVIAKGVNLDIFKANPIVTFAHKYDELPVGRAKWIKLVQRGLLAKTQYAKKPEGWQGPWLPDAVFSMTQEGILKGKSIGFLPTRIRSATKEEISLNPTWKNANAVIESCVLLEYAVAPVPCNQDALTIAVSKGLDPKLAEKLGLKVPEVKAKTVKAKRPDYYGQLLKALGEIDLDPDRIAEEVYEQLRSRGRV
jgi:hypothetical protein